MIAYSDPPWCLSYIGPGIPLTPDRDGQRVGKVDVDLRGPGPDDPFPNLGEVRFGYMRMEKTLVPSAMTAAVA